MEPINAIESYQRKCREEYKRSIGYPDGYRYYTGNEITPLVPLEIACNGVMVVGAYPTARFYTYRGVTDTPLEDIKAPFSDEIYQDGSRERTVLSGMELNNVILSNIGVARNDCWITNLVKVFLFKEGHIKRYHRLGGIEGLGAIDMTANRHLFEEFAAKSLDWIKQEISLAKPYAIILLGAEVTASVMGVSEDKAKNYLDGNIYQASNLGAKVICLPHPGILMRKNDPRNPWPERFVQVIAPTASAAIMSLRAK